MPPGKARTVLLAADIVGGADQLAARVHARGELAGRVPLPDHMYQQCIEIVVACLLDDSVVQRQADLSIERQASLV
jgi:hypothetical protein